MGELDDLREQVISELYMLENKGLAALPSFFQEKNIRAIPRSGTQCVLAQYLSQLFPSVNFSVQISNSGVSIVDEITLTYGILGDGTTFVQLPLDLDINEFACRFDREEYPELQTFGSKMNNPL